MGGLKRLWGAYLDSEAAVPLTVLILCFGSFVLALLLDLHYQAHP